MILLYRFMKKSVLSKHPRNNTFFGKDVMRGKVRDYLLRTRQGARFRHFMGSEREVKLFTNNSLWAKPLNYYQIFAREKT